MSKSRRLNIIAAVSLTIYILILSLGSSEIKYPLPSYNKAAIFNYIVTESEKLNLPSFSAEDVTFINAKANNSIGRYVESYQFDERQLDELQQKVPIYTIEVETGERLYEIDPSNGKITRVSGISLPFNEKNSIDNFIQTYFGSGYTLQTKKASEDEIFTDWHIKYVYTASTSLDNISKVVEIYTSENKIIEFQQYGAAAGFPLQEAEDSAGLMIISIFMLLFLVALLIIVTVQLIKRLIKKQIEAFVGPFLLSAVAGFGWFFLTSAMGSSITGFGAIEPAFMTYLTFATLLIRWEKSAKSHAIKILEWKGAIFQGLLLAIIFFALTSLFFYITGFFGSWISPVLNHGLLINVNPWILPIFTLFIGLSAAVTEEAVFRRYMIPFFDRFGVITSVLLTSFLWGILHLAYDVHPWYLRVIEFMIIGGPFFYFVYKKFGFKTAVFCHYFNNSLITAFFLFSVNINVAIVALFLSVSPLLFLLYRTK
ncbi:type II CAAX endopeptidase family protein [Metabacillus fastidiosus]|uniref:CPBP family intramembrane glutamic endopeptidase n=1 Tax=Metabacillus fastidiosus TaxID=1458 RepID=UPI003D281D50